MRTRVYVEIYIYTDRRWTIPGGRLRPGLRPIFYDVYILHHLDFSFFFFVNGEIVGEPGFFLFNKKSGY